MDPFNWKPNFLDFKKNIIEDDIIPDELLQGIQDKINSYCSSNYNSYQTSANVGYSRECNDSGGESNCSCDISGVNCYPADCSTDKESTCGCNAAVYNNTDLCKKDICNKDES